MYDHAYLINIKSREDRLKSALKECNKLGIKPEIIEAVEPYNGMCWTPDPSKEGWNEGAAALVYSTIKILTDAKNKGYEKILILEDDIMFGSSAIKKLEALELPEDTAWDMFHFGTMDDISPNQVNGQTVRLNKSYCCHMYMIQSRVFDDYLFYLKKVDQPIDWITANVFQPFGRCFGMVNPIAYQRPNYSNIRNKEVNYTSINT